MLKIVIIVSIIVVVYYFIKSLMGNAGDGEPGTAAMDMIQMLSVKIAKDLQLDMSMKNK